MSDDICSIKLNPELENWHKEIVKQICSNIKMFPPFFTIEDAIYNTLREGLKQFNAFLTGSLQQDKVELPEKEFISFMNLTAKKAFLYFESIKKDIESNRLSETFKEES